MSPTLRGRWRGAVYTLAAVVGMLGAYLMWRATQLEGSSLDRAFGVGLTLEVCGVLIAWGCRSAAYRARDEAVENQLAGVRRELRELQKKYNKHVGDVEFDTATRALTEAVQLATGHQQQKRGRVWLVPPQGPSPRS